MSKAGSRIIKSARRALAFAEGKERAGFRVHVPDEIDVKAVRRKVGLSQADFARRFGFSQRTVQDWEQGHRMPSGPSRVLLHLIAREPEIVMRVLR